MRRAAATILALVASVTLGSVTLGVGIASAESYPPGGPSIGTPSSTPHPGDSITITLDGYCPNDDVHLLANGPGGEVDLGVITVDGSGIATFPYTALDALGTYVISGTGSDCPEYVATMSIIVVTNIPVMGTDSTKSGLLIGSGAVGFGVLLVGAAAIRRRRPAAA